MNNEELQIILNSSNEINRLIRAVSNKYNISSKTSLMMLEDHSLLFTIKRTSNGSFNKVEFVKDILYIKNVVILEKKNNQDVIDALDLFYLT